MTYKKLRQRDITLLSQLIRLYEQAFEMDDFMLPDDEYLQTLLEDEFIIFYVAISDNIVIGGLTAHIIPSVYEPTSEVYIYDLAVNPNYQRQGIGTHLLAALAQECSTLGYKEIFVQADIEDQHAIEFYRATGGEMTEVVHFSYNLGR